VLFARLGAGASVASLRPGFLLFGAGAGLMNVPLTNAMLHSVPPGRSGIASALINASRELAGLLGITIIGAVLRARQGSALHQGHSAATSFLDGYHAGLALTVGLVALGAVVSYLALRRAPSLTAAPAQAQDPAPALTLADSTIPAAAAAAESAVTDESDGTGQLAPATRG
jgi:hypothetical protein